ncbi:acidic proline-rich protein PRP25-like, partial [Penaeus monodon]|uniref:acidic proline-rich protein PRP25-like n=1 Tax=Penaeus monodon TaxID=6687 RepID=UPI0018A7C4F3
VLLHCGDPGNATLNYLENCGTRNSLRKTPQKPKPSCGKELAKNATPRLQEPPAGQPPARLKKWGEKATLRVPRGKRLNPPGAPEEKGLPLRGPQRKGYPPGGPRGTVYPSGSPEETGTPQGPLRGR